MNGPNWLEITRLLQGNFTSIFGFGDTVPEPPPRDRWPSDPLAGGDLPPQTPIRGTSPPCTPPRGGVYSLPGVYIRLKPLIIEDNQAPHPTISHVETDDSALDLAISHLLHHT